MAREIEAKIKVADLRPLRLRLGGLGAAREGAYRERNWVLDDGGETLRQGGRLFRVRSLGGAGGIVTVKVPAPGRGFKTREELETMVDSAEGFLGQMRLLGYRVRWIYDKRREAWTWRGAAIALDSLPEMGAFVEIEGEEGVIRDACSRLGLDPADHIDDSYLGLWEKYLARRGEPKRDMVFAAGAAHEGNGGK